MLAEAETWVAVAFVIFVGVLIYFGIHTMITGALDQRSARIRADLDEARRLKEEAAALLAEYRRKQQTAAMYNSLRNSPLPRLESLV